MIKNIYIPILILMLMVTFNGCTKAYKAAPVSFMAPDALGNSVKIDGAEIGARAYNDKTEASEAFGFDIIGAGMLPVQVVFDNKSGHIFEINGQQSFLEDTNGKLWPVLSREMAYERASHYSRTEQILTKGSSSGIMGAAAGAIVGAAVGIVRGDRVSSAIGKGAAVGGAIGILGGGVEGYQNQDAHRAISEDLREKSLQNKSVLPDTIAYGILFYPAEAVPANKLRLSLVETDTSKSHSLTFDLSVRHKPL